MKLFRLAQAGLCGALGCTMLAGCIPTTAGPAAPAGTQPAAVQTERVPAATNVPEPSDFEFGGELTQGGWIRGVVPAGTVEAALDGKPLSIAPDGSFFAAFDRDAASSVKLSARQSDGSMILRGLSIAPRAWNIERVNVARRQGGPSEAFMRIREPELARIAAARALRTGSEGWRQTFIWPLKGRISGRFGSQRIYRGEPGSYHSGIDIATGESGTPFVAPADGVVVLAAETPFSLEGNLLMIDHGMGLNSAFLHCSELAVKNGERVKQGQYIGRIGMSGRATGPHLHWSMKWQDARIDPILFTGPMN